MARSRRHTPIIGLTGNRSPGQKLFKKQEHSRERSAIKQKLKQGEYENLPSPKQFGNEWDSPRDGKTYFGNGPTLQFYWISKSISKNNKLLRK